MKKRAAVSLRSILPYLAAAAAAFYAVPLLVPAVNAEAAFPLLSASLLLINPVCCFTSVFLYGLRYGFCWFLPLLEGAAFIPAVFVFFNYTAFTYVLTYIAAAYLGAGAAAAAVWSRTRDKD